MNKKYFLLKIVPPTSMQSRFELFLNENISCGWEETEDNTFKIYFSSKTEQQNFLKKISQEFKEIDIKTEEIESKKWANEWKKFFSPISIGNFYIVPSWLTDNKKNKVQISIYPEMAFGTGHHPTTRLCLLCIQELYKKGLICEKEQFLDIGTGSGILGIGASLLGLNGIGFDLDILTLKNLKTNIKLNKVHNKFHPFIGTISAIKNNVLFKLIVANILLEPLCQLKQDIFNHLKTHGFLIVSGILINQESRLIESYKKFFSYPFKILRQDEWSAIIWQKE